MQGRNDSQHIPVDHMVPVSPDQRDWGVVEGQDMEPRTAAQLVENALLADQVAVQVEHLEGDQ